MKSVWEFLNSLKLTVYLVLAITAVTMYGSMVIYFYPEQFGDMDQHVLFPWLVTSGLKSLSLTWWLFLLVLMVALLGINTLVCTIMRLPLLIRRYRDPLLNLRDIEMGGGEGKEVSFAEGPGQSLTVFLKSRRYKVFVVGKNLYAEKNRWLPFMPYVVHIGIMLFMVGHLIGGIYGYRNSGLSIFEGETAPSPSGGYFLRLNKVKVETFPDGNLKYYGSNLTALRRDGTEIKTGWSGPNKPMFVEGSAVYQRAFGQDVKGVYLYIEIRSAGFKNYVMMPRGAGYVNIPGGYLLGIADFIPDAAFDERGVPYIASDEFTNPAALVSVRRSDGQETRGWVYLKEPGRDGFRNPDVSVHFADIKMQPYSSFDVNRDPSWPIALFASVIVMLVTVITLYFRRERVWAGLDESGRRAQVICTDDELYEKM